MNEIMKQIPAVKALGQVKPCTFECTSHGSVNGWESERAGMVCPKCVDDSIKITPDINREQHFIEISGIPERYQKEMRPSGFGREMADYVRDFKTEWSHLCFSGPTGTGKTHGAARVGIALIKMGYFVQMWVASEMMSRIKESYSSGDTSSVFNRLAKDVDILIIDEIDLVHTDHDINKLSELIRARYAASKPIITTTNRDFESLKCKIGDRAASALADNMHMIKPTGGDARYGGNK